MKNKILSARYAMEKSRDTSSLTTLLFLIPIAIIILTLLIVLLVVTEINKTTTNFDETASNIYDTTSSITENNENLLVLASSSSPLTDEYNPNLEDYNGIKYNSMLDEPLTMLINAAQNDDIKINVTGGYVSASEQDKLFQAEVNRLINEFDYSQVKAETEAEKSVPKGNEYDRQTGLSVILSTDDEYSWLALHAYEYGFIQRYTKAGEETTNVKADATLYRYIGTENAKKIRMLGMSLDEYVDYVNSR